MSSQKMLNWLNKNVDGVYISEHAITINEKIMDFMKKNDISFKGDKNLFFMKLLLFLHKNSSV